MTRQSPTTASACLMEDGAEPASGNFEGAMPVFIFSSNETFDIGKDTGTAMLDGAQSPYPFSGAIGEVAFDVAVPE